MMNDNNFRHVPVVGLPTFACKFNSAMSCLLMASRAFNTYNRINSAQPSQQGPPAQPAIFDFLQICSDHPLYLASDSLQSICL